MDLPGQPTPVPSTATPVSQPQPPPPSLSNPPVGLEKKSPWKTILIVVLLLVVVGAVAYFVARSLGLIQTPSSGPVTLTWWGLWEDNSVVQPLITEYEAANPEIKINYVFQSQREYRERLQNALSQGEGPDIFRLHNSWVPMFRGNLAPVSPSVYSAQDFEATFYPTTRADLRSGNSYVAVPLEIDGLAMYVNEELFLAAGKSVPQSWEELRQTAIDLSVCDTQDGTCRSGDRVLVSGAALGTTDNVDHWQDIVAVLMLQNNVNLNSPSGKPAEDVLEYYTVFSRIDGVWNSTLPNSTQAFAQGKVAVYFAPSWRAFDILALNPGLKFRTHPIPQLPIDPALGEKPVTWASYWAEGVNVASVNSEAAWQFVAWLASQDTLQKFYQNAVASGRAFGEPYSRVDMASLVQADPYVGAYINQAPNARSWYLASFTWDGPTGINSRISQYFADAINGVNQGRSAAENVKTLNSGVNQVLSQYGLAVQAPSNP